MTARTTIIGAGQKPRLAERMRDNRSRLRGFFSRSKDESTERRKPSVPTAAKSTQEYTSSTNEPSTSVASDADVTSLATNYWRLAEIKLEAEKPDIYQHFEKLQQNSANEPNMAWLQDALFQKSHEFTGDKPRIRSNVEKLLRSVMVFGSLASTAGKFDPTGAAPLAWTGICSIMQVSSLFGDSTNCLWSNWKRTRLQPGAYRWL